MLPASLLLVSIGLLSGIIGLEAFCSQKIGDSEDDNLEDDHEREEEFAEEITFILPACVEGDTGLNNTHQGDVEELKFSEEDLENLPDLFSSSYSNGGSNTVIAGEAANVAVLLPAGTSGSIHAIEADYVEEFRDAEFEVTRVHGGVNLYYVPEGFSFPAELSWSEDGATLFSEDPSAEAKALVSGIKMLARIESGVSSFQKSLEDGSMQTQNGDLGTPEISSNIPISW